VIAGLLSRAWAYLAGVGAALAGLGAVYLAGRRSGTQAARTRAMAEDLNNAQTRAAVDRDTAGAADPAGELRRRWSRD